MKKIILFLSLLVCILILPACEEKATYTEEDPVDITSEAEKDLTDVAEENMIAEIEQDATEIVTEEKLDESGNISQLSLYKVVRVVDGDTIVINFNGTDEKVRFIGVDTPESVHSNSDKNTEEGTIASDFTKELLSDKSVSLEFDVSERDRYGRLLAYVYLDGEMINKTLLNEGYAKVATYPPNVAYVDEFTELQRIARENKVGFWGIASEEIVDTPKVSNSGGERLVGSINSNKYHKEGYTHNGQIAEHNLVYFESIEDAISKGYIPCKLCYK